MIALSLSLQVVKLPDEDDSELLEQTNIEMQNKMLPIALKIFRRVIQYKKFKNNSNATFTQS